jgi:SnoaL-like domain
MDLATLLARAEITDVLTDYVRGADRNDWELIRRCYHPDATDDHGLYAGDIDGLIAFLAKVAATLTATFHQLGPPRIEVDGGMARSETYCFGWYERPGNDGAIWSIAQGLRYLDEFELRDDRWAIANRIVVLDWERVFNPGRASAPAASWQRGARGAADPSFTFLTNRPSEPE